MFSAPRCYWRSDVPRGCRGVFHEPPEDMAVPFRSGFAFRAYAAYHEPVLTIFDVLHQEPSGGPPAVRGFLVSAVGVCLVHERRPDVCLVVLGCRRGMMNTSQDAIKYSQALAFGGLINHLSPRRHLKEPGGGNCRGLFFVPYVLFHSERHVSAFNRLVYGGGCQRYGQALSRTVALNHLSNRKRKERPGQHKPGLSLYSDGVWLKV